MLNKVKIKVCGMRHPQNVEQVNQLGIDFMGFIFYPKSARFVETDFDPAIPKSLDTNTKSVGVFVNAEIDYVLACCKRYGFEFVQLHGSESVAYCQQMRAAGLQVIKAFGVDESFNFEQLEAYEEHVDYFLFDTKTKAHGGSGVKFSWELLSAYKLSRPFFLSGGIGPTDGEALQQFEHEKLFALDLNSKFEAAPAQKNTALLQSFLHAVAQYNS